MFELNCIQILFQNQSILVHFLQKKADNNLLQNLNMMKNHEKHLILSYALYYTFHSHALSLDLKLNHLYLLGNFVPLLD